MKKSILALAGLSLLLAGCAGGGGGGSVEPGKLKIRFHVNSTTAEGMAYKKLIDAFNLQHKDEGLKVTASFVARTAGDSAYERQLYQDRINGTLPDIITFDAPNCASYANAEYLYDISSYFSSSEKEQFLSVNEYKGKLYGLPIQESSAGFYYNKRLFNEAGIDVSGITVDNPWTFNEFKAACQKLSSKNIKAVDMRLYATQDETATYLLYPFIYAAGGSFVDSTGFQAKGYFDSEASIKGYQFIRDLLDAGYTDYIANNDFFLGKVGMYLSSGWTILDLDNKFPDYFPNRDSWGLLPYPKDVRAVSATGSWSYAVGNNSRTDKTDVIKLLKFLTSATSSKAITDATKMIPANKEAETSYTAGSPEDVLYQQLQKTGEARPSTVGYPDFSSNFSTVISGLKSGSVASLVQNRAEAFQNALDKIKR